MTRLINFKPAEGVTVINPETDQPIKAEGEVVFDDVYWRRRELEGSGTISEPTKKSK